MLNPYLSECHKCMKFFPGVSSLEAASAANLRLDREIGEVFLFRFSRAALRLSSAGSSMQCMYTGEALLSQAIGMNLYVGLYLCMQVYL